MKKLWILFIAIFVASFAVLGWVGTEIFRQAPPIPSAVVTTDGRVLVSGDDIQNGQNVWQAMGGMEMGSIWGHGSYVAPDWTADYLHNESVMILDQWSQNQFTKSYSNISSEQQAMLRQGSQARSLHQRVDVAFVVSTERFPEDLLLDLERGEPGGLG